MPDSINYVI